MSESTPPQSAYIVSDLHIFGCNSLFDRYAQRFYQGVSSHQVLVLNGDSFDFKRSTYRSAAETTLHAIRWLQELCQRFPNQTIHYVLGNHDSHDLFLRALKEHLPALPNLCLSTDSLRLGAALFLHGDAIDLPKGSHNLHAVRSRYVSCEPNARSRFFANLVTSLRLNKLEYLRHSNLILADRLLNYLDATQPGFREITRVVYFGHTHIPIDDFCHGGIIFRNTGSMIRGLPWRPMEHVLSE